ncbi:hypothetical protein CR513_47160, partial [Mucuna pruriens]
MFMLQAIWTLCFKLFKKKFATTGEGWTYYQRMPNKATMANCNRLTLEEDNRKGVKIFCNFAIVDYQVSHKRIRHPNSNVLHDMLKSGFLGNEHTSSLNAIYFYCISCKLGKGKILSFPTHHPNVIQPFDIIHGVTLIISHANCKYFVTFIDNYSRFTWVYFLHSKDEVFSTFKFFYAYVQTQFSSKIKIFRFHISKVMFINHTTNGLSSPSLGNESLFSRLFGHSPDYSIVRIFECVCVLYPSSSTRTYQAQCTICSMCFSWLFFSSKGHSMSLEMISSKNIFFFLQHDMTLHSPIIVLSLFSNSLAGPPQDNSLVVAAIRELESATLHHNSRIRKPQKAIETELLALDENQTRDKVSCPLFVKLLGSKFVFFVKLCLDGSIDQYGPDYDETFALVTKMTTVHTLLALVASQSLSLHQMDVKNKFLHDGLKEEVYIKLPYDIHTHSPNIVCKLKCYLYGLKSFATILGFSFTQSGYDPSLFLQRTPKGIAVLLVYVDDIVKCTITLKIFFLNQQKHIQDLIQLARLTNPTLVDTLLEVNVKYKREECDILDHPTLYCKLVSSPIYVTITRLDISFIVHTISKFMQSPQHFYFLAKQQIIKYLCLLKAWFIFSY